VVWLEIVFGALLVVVLLLLAVYYARHQVLALRRLRHSPELPAEELRYERRKAHRRLISCGLLLVMAAMLASQVALYALPTSELVEQRKSLDPKSLSEYTPEEQALLRAWSWTWIALLLVLMAVLALAAVDLLSTRQFALRQFRKLQEDRRAMIERQAERMRRDRNGIG
jgi:hypothetical protein